MLKIVDSHVKQDAVHVLDLKVRLVNLLHEDEKHIQDILALADIDKVTCEIEQNHGSVFLNFKLPRKGN